MLLTNFPENHICRVTRSVHGGGFMVAGGVRVGVVVLWQLCGLRSGCSAVGLFYMGTAAVRHPLGVFSAACGQRRKDALDFAVATVRLYPGSVAVRVAAILGGGFPDRVCGG